MFKSKWVLMNTNDTHQISCWKVPLKILSDQTNLLYYVGRSFTIRSKSVWFGDIQSILVFPTLPWRHSIDLIIFNPVVSDWSRIGNEPKLAQAKRTSIERRTIDGSSTKFIYSKVFFPNLILFFLIWSPHDQFLPSTGRDLDCLLSKPGVMP